MSERLALDASLESMRHGSWIRTPFFEIEVYSRADHPRLNRLDDWFNDRVDSAKSNGDWDTFSSLHLAAQRERVFMEVAGEIHSPDHNRIAGNIWTDPQIIRPRVMLYPGCDADRSVTSCERSHDTRRTNSAASHAG